MSTTAPPAEKSLEALANGDVLYEVVNGQLVELPPMGVFETSIASRLMYYLEHFARAQNLGRAFAEMLFLLDAAAVLKRRPDVAYVSYERWPRGRAVPRQESWDVAPDLAVEVVSATNTAEEIVTKVREYFQAGVKRVWVVYPVEQQVYVYHSPTQIHILTRTDELDGEDFLPGFRLPLATLFESEGEESAINL